MESNEGRKSPWPRAAAAPRPPALRRESVSPASFTPRAVALVLIAAYFTFMFLMQFAS